VFLGFDDNRSLGEGETGAHAAVPVFIDFMTEALKGAPAEPFRAPANARFAMVRGIREAFRPGTEPQVDTTAPAGPAGPIPYDKLLDEAAPGAPIAPVAPVPAPTPKKPDDVRGLF